MTSCSPSLTVKRILLLEDEFILALDAAASLKECGAIGVGLPAAWKGPWP